MARSCHLVAGLLAAALAVLAACGASPAQAMPDRALSATAPEPSWRVELTGGVSRLRTFDNRAAEPADRVTSQARDRYRATVTVLFRIGAGGVVTGFGSGRYTEAEWHLEGTNGARGRFACDPPVTARPFGVTVSGRATADRVVLQLTLEASETNADTPCGAAYTAYATRTTYLADSWIEVSGGRLAFDRERPVIAPLRDRNRSSTATTTQSATHEWHVSVRPPAPRPTGPAATSEPVVRPPRKPALPRGIGVVPRRSECTIAGTPYDDVLTGTIGRDVICGLGGNDTIAGFAGDDVIVGGSGADVIAPGPGRDRVFGGPGADRIGARDGRRDLINGGPGQDQVWADPGLDQVAFAELVYGG